MYVMYYCLIKGLFFQIRNTVDDQIALAELEYRLAQEEMTLLSLQEQHWEAAALWDVPRTPDIQVDNK